MKLRRTPTPDETKKIARIKHRGTTSGIDFVRDLGQRKMRGRTKERKKKRTNEETTKERDIFAYL